MFEFDLWTVLVEGVQKTQARGTSTFVMALLDNEDPILRALNLGDSGYMLLRRPESDKPYEAIFRSEEKQYKFNHPYQCGTNYKMPWHSDVHLHVVKQDDVLIMGTDGVYDNLFDKDIMQCVNTSPSPPQLDKDFNSQDIADCIAKKAEKFSFDKKYDSPFAVHAREQGYKYPGGKKDDITVVVAKLNVN